MADTPDLAGIIAQTLADTREKGLDHIGQTEHAIRAVLVAGPDMTASDTLQAVNRGRRVGAALRRRSGTHWCAFAVSGAELRLRP